MTTVAASRPLVNVYDGSGSSTSTQVELPAVFQAPIRPDIVQFAHTNMAKNARQAYAVNRLAGHQTSAESWGTGRAVARIPRVGGGGTHRSGQGAFGNMCRSGRMFAPTRIWRKWHRKLNKKQRRYATVSSLAASALPALIMARGHRIDDVKEVPLVLSDATIAATKKTREAVTLLEKVGAIADVNRCKDSKKIRSGKGKMRNRRYVMRRGPLIVYADENSKEMERAFRNLPGVELCHVDRMNLLQLAPGGHMGRFCIWTEAAFKRLNAVFGTHTQASEQKKGYTLPKKTMTNGDLARLINSEEIQSVLNDKKQATRRSKLKKNPLKNLGAMMKLNPYAYRAKQIATKEKADKASRKAAIAKKRHDRKMGRAFLNGMMTQ
eukprot:g3350.t1